MHVMECYENYVIGAINQVYQVHINSSKKHNTEWKKKRKRISDIYIYIHVNTYTYIDRYRYRYVTLILI